MPKNDKMIEDARAALRRKDDEAADSRKFGREFSAGVTSVPWNENKWGSSPTPKPVCAVCGKGPKYWGDSGSMGVGNTCRGIGPVVLVHSNACMRIWNEAKGEALKQCKIGPHGQFDKPAADLLLDGEIAKLIDKEINRSAIASQFGTVHALSPRTGERVRLDRLEAEMDEIRKKLYVPNKTRPEDEAAIRQQAKKNLVKADADRREKYQPKRASAKDTAQRRIDAKK